MRAEQTQSHDFNTPAQLAAYNSEEEYDTADDAVVYEIDLEAGDLIIFGTDGLFDNMWNDEMEAHIAGHCKVSAGLFVLRLSVLNHGGANIGNA